MAKKLFEQPTYFSNFFSGVQSIFLLEQYHPSMGTKSKILAKSERYIFCCCQDFQRQKKLHFPMAIIHETEHESRRTIGISLYRRICVRSHLIFHQVLHETQNQSIELLPQKSELS